MQSMVDAGESTEFVQQGYGEKEPYWDKDIKWFQFPDDSDYHAYRLVGKPFYLALHWINSKKRDGTKGKSFSALCKNYDSTVNRYGQNGCKYCEYKDLAAKQLGKIKFKDWPEPIQRMAPKTTMASNAIIRELQQAGAPSNNAAAWTFIQQVKFPEGFSNTLKENTDKLNKIAGKVYGFNHKDHGKDLLISYNSQAKEKAKMYQMQMGERTPLTAEELAHAKYLVDFHAKLLEVGYPKESSCETALQKNGYYDLLESLNASSNLKEIQKGAPVETPVVAPQVAPQAVAPQVAQQAAPAPAPVAAAPQPTVSPIAAAYAAQQVAPAPVVPTAFDVPADGGGLAAATGGSVTAETGKSVSAAASLAEPPPPRFDHQEPLPSFTPAPAPTPVAPVAAPAPVVPQVAPIPVPATPVPVAAPVAAAAPPPPAPATAPVSGPPDLISRLSAFVASVGLTLAAHDKEYSDVRAFKRGMLVPTCFTKYTETMPKKFCSKCPMRLDCMITDTV